MPRRYQADAIAIGIDQEARFLHALSRNNQFSVAARRCGRQGLRVMVKLDDGALRVVPVLFLPAANRQHMIEAKTYILLPEPQHRLQIVRRKSDVDDVFLRAASATPLIERHIASVSETSQGLPATAIATG